MSMAISLTFLFYGIATSILIPFCPFFILCCLCGQNGILIAKINFYLVLSSLIILLLTPFIFLGGLLNSLCEFFKNYYFIAIQRISPTNKFKKNYRLLLSLTNGSVSRIIDYLSKLKQKLIKKSGPQK